ncbi:MAG: DUF512 domain-containing protein [Oscillospiraceae bacterium]|jgi:putative radical SAM enzyme (TIGR03279 family)|nr:DUF512 domain-containing protein [Oscillospiraceae bacterium]
MNPIIKSVAPNSPASRAGIAAGDKLRRINGHAIRDVLDYKFHSYDGKLLLEAERTGGGVLLARLRKRDGEDIGLEFETYLMDAPISCANRCVFCFIDQLPKGMRETLYYKDDDTRLSFLQGNYVTLTNMSESDIRRVIDMKISPLNVSVHSMEPETRALLLGNKNGGKGVETLRRLAGAGITMNCQIVCCPGINDGESLSRTMRELAALYPEVNSVSVVPVGLTRHREGLPQLTPFNAQSADETINRVETYAAECEKTHGSRIFFCADELYIKANRPLPEDDAYEGYPQLENGVGMMRLLISEFEDALNEPLSPDGREFSIATGVSAASFLKNLLNKAQEKCRIKGNVYAIHNDFFGESVNVAGLVTGGDLLRQLNGKPLGERLLIPRNMLRAGEDKGGGVFLDDVTVDDLSSELGVRVRIVEQDGADLLRAMCGR